eukprot:m.115395 g.115395  ORF g.115395 m.115395 type:complete len:104 (+) comp9289_c0_seq8:3002-3313(+)
MIVKSAKAGDHAMEHTMVIVYYHRSSSWLYSRRPTIRFDKNPFLGYAKKNGLEKTHKIKFETLQTKQYIPTIHKGTALFVPYRLVECELLSSINAPNSWCCWK